MVVEDDDRKWDFTAKWISVAIAADGGARRGGAGGGEARRRWGEPMQQLVGPGGAGARDPRGRLGRRGADESI